MRLTHGLNKKQETISKLQQLKKKQRKFSLTLDEWTSLRTKRYININVHSEVEYYCLGLVKIEGSSDSVATQRYVEQKLLEFGLSFDQDIVCSTSDGAAVMEKYGRESPAKF